MLFRSETMSFCQLIIPKDIILQTLTRLGEIGIVQFINLNEGLSSLNLPYTADIHELTEIERQIQHIYSECKEFKVVVPKTQLQKTSTTIKEINEISSEIDKLENSIEEISKNAKLLEKVECNLLEAKFVLEFCHDFFKSAGLSLTKDSLTSVLLHDATIAFPMKSDDFNAIDISKLEYISGTISIKRKYAFEVMLWRVCRSNFCITYSKSSIRSYDSCRNITSEVEKLSFFLFFHGEAIKAKILKICEGFHCNLIHCPESAEDRNQMIQSIQVQIGDMKVVATKTEAQKIDMLKIMSGKLYPFLVKVKKMKDIYFIMNHLILDPGNRFYMGECWLPTKDLHIVKENLELASMISGTKTSPSMISSRPSGRKIAPTHLKLNKFTKGFQAIVDAYGTPNYKEMNPTPFTIITFPFLFAVMFGDWGHGLIMASLAFYMILNEKKFSEKSLNDVFHIIFEGRYIIFLMGIFSIYTGWLYNDIFSLAVKLAPSSWRHNRHNITRLDELNEKITLDPMTDYDGLPYFFGFDPMLNSCGDSSILIVNSLKMKMSIILGFFHMLMGIILSAFNAVFHKSYISFFLVFLPTLLFFCALFGYLVLLMFYKWIVFSPKNKPPFNHSCAPSIINVFINMLMFRSSKEVEGCEKNMFKGQQHVQLFLLIIAIASVPTLLLGKPIYVAVQNIKFRKKQQKRTAALKLRASTKFTQASVMTESEVPEFEHFTEVIIHQGIHTIETVLGSLSHTASYLRLWALSLAHEQLSKVLWDMILQKAFAIRSIPGFIVVFFVFIAWSSLTFSILIAMEGLSAFLHTLRLHWVEFQSKYYSGTGEKFFPFKFPTVELR